MLLLPPLLPALVHTHPPLFTHSHSPNPTHLFPLSAPVHPLLVPGSCSPAPISLLPRLCLPVHVIHIPTPTCTRPPTHSFMLVYAHSSVLVPTFIWPSFMLICAHSVVCPFSLHLCLFVPTWLFAHVAFMWPLFMLICAHSAYLPSFVSVSNILLVHT